MMYGKHFACMYHRSMYGKGAHVFAVWGYVIANQEPDKGAGGEFQVEINPDELAHCLGEPVEKVQAAIDFLCSPDARSTSKAEGGRRLVRIGEFAYRVVNGKKYYEMKKKEDRLMQNREAQERYRDRKKNAGRKGCGGARMTQSERLEEGFRQSGREEEADRVEELREGSLEIERRERAEADANSKAVAEREAGWVEPGRVSNELPAELS